MGLFDFLGGDITSRGSWGSTSSPVSKVISDPVGGMLRDVIADVIADLFSRDSQKNRSLEDGDVVGVSRGIYDHYGIYIGGNRVIHYSSENSDISANNKVIETSFKNFLKGSSTYFILNLEYTEPRKYSRLAEAERQGLLSEGNGLFGAAIRAWQKSRKQEVFGPKETIFWAKSCLDENNYNLLLNNCEHFAIWCKTGLSKSHQINAILKGSPRIIV